MIPYLNNVKLHCSMANVSYREQPSAHVFYFPELQCDITPPRFKLIILGIRLGSESLWNIKGLVCKTEEFKVFDRPF